MRQKLADLKALAEKLKDQIKEAVNELYTLGNSTEGLPLSTILTDWIDNVIEAENLKAEIEVLGERIKEFQKQYAIYAPAGANLKRIEREISVSEQEFLEILHGLNLAKLKQQDNELSSNLKTVDEPFFPLSPIPTKRKILIVMAAMVGFVIVLAIILVLEYFDDTIKNQNKTSKILKMPLIGIFPKILLKLKVTNFPFIFNRLLEMTIQDIEIYLEEHKKDKSPKTLLFFSTLPKEGKSVVAGNLAHKLKKDGEKVVVLNYSDESLYKAEQEQIGYKDIASADYISGSVKQRNRISFIPLILGYPDTRIDFDSPFLENPENYLGNEEIFRYNIDEKFNSVKNYQEILDQNGIRLSSIPDYILIELPPVLHHPYPVGLIMNADLPVLVCRSNRVWTPADQGAIDTLVKMTGQKTHFILNGVELSVIESVLGDLPKKRSRIRRAMKNILRFQFFSKNQI